MADSSSTKTTSKSKNEAPSCKEEVDEVKKKGIKLLIYDMKQKKLIPIKVLFFLVISSIGVLVPFMTVHMKSLGISVSETAVIYGVFPPFAILAPSTMGMVADKLGNFKVLLSVIMVILGANALLFLIIPTGRFVDTYPANVSFGLGCDGNGGLILTDLDSKSCDWSASSGNLPNLTVTQCGFVCYDHKTVIESGAPALQSDWLDDQPYRKYRNALFFQESWSPDVTCFSIDGRKSNCTLDRGTSWEPAKRNTTAFLQVVLKLNQSDTNNVYPIERMLLNGVQPLRDEVQCGDSYDHPVYLSKPLTFKLNNTLKSDEGTLVYRPENPAEPEESLITYQACWPECIVQAPRRQLCANKALEVEFDPSLTFWVYLLLRASYGLLLGGSMVLFEGAALAVVLQYKGDLGLQRAFGVFGIMIFSPISGALIDHFSLGRDIPDYRPAFYLYAGMICIAAVGVLMVDLDFKPPAKELMKDIRSLFKNVELVVFFVVVLLSGLFWGFIESYLFWFLEEMGGNKSLMGLTVTVSALSGIPALLCSDFVFRKIGHPSVQVIGFAVYTIRLVGYSYIYDPYMCLVYEAMEAVTTSLMTTSAIAYSAQLGTTTTLATIQGIIGGAYYGVGRGMGSLVGGFMMRSLSPDPLTSLEIGTRYTFRYLGVAAFGTGFLYFLFDQFYIRRRNNNKKTEENDAGMKIENCVPNKTNQGLENPNFVPDEQTLDNKTIAAMMEDEQHV